ncbi:asparagine synthetase B [Dulcicalothrix desertica PCC 7102]|uniref:asparagine synthase (glutamine-hydrolyzing) n=1 Tax=Dulcicalothrix desertica PCC 7102 TaxID=232991 RepID=A0A3S1ISP4_9CYAN|nr:asparagine synthetase B family protein [Dulcicalothrix desertica]RUT01759.1 asparagine synthetase B [Dulcicalothrix desertica PCC 7102]TWH42910.1 asparagine synthase (glutamine-hydrolysing) [Dulcicalothrix desertica PCC 7102]
MLFNAFFNRESIAAPGNVVTTWQIAYGYVDSLSVENIFWRDNKVIIIAPDSKAVAFSSNQRFVVVGDVWLSNRRELSVAYSISINNDIQLVAQLWEKFGIESLKLLVGMFGLVIWDKDEQVLYSARDCTGSRTIYYTTNGLTRWLAPSLRTLAPYRSKDLDVVALRDYLCCAFVPGNRTLWNDVKELRPGTILKLPSGEIHSFWQLKEQIIDSDKALSWHGEKLRQLLDQVIKEYLPQNQPVGVLLSGGLDSSSVTALVSKLHNAPVHTFSIHFGAECPNELEFSSMVADHCQTQHHILEITFKDMWERLPEVMTHLDDPIGDPLTVPNLLVAQLAREYVGTILNGEGGDPCFGGPKNQPMLINNLYGSVTNQDTLQAYLTSFQKCAVDLPLLLKPDVWKAVSNAPSVFTEDLYSKDNYLNRLMAINIKYKGADQILTKVNNTSTAAGLLGLSPLFDQRVVDLSMQIPPQYKLSGVEEKAVLKQAVADIVPDAIINRPKSGMMVPVQLGFRKYWQREARSLLLNRNAMTAPYFNQSLIKDWLNYRGDTWRRYGVKLWLLVSLEIWLQVNR